MSIINLPFTFTAGATIIAAQFNSNFQTIYNDYNGNVNNANISSSSTFPDSVLQQIQTAGKVNASALTLLANIPSGAGLIPTANLGTGTASTYTYLSGAQTFVSSGVQPILGLHDSGAQTIPNNVWTQRTTWSVLKDSGGYWSSNAYTPLIAGWYLVIYTDAMGTAPGQQYQIAIYKNGAQYITSGTSTQNSLIASMSAMTIVQMNGSTDNVTFFLNQLTGGNQTAEAGYGSVCIIRIF